MKRTNRQATLFIALLAVVLLSGCGRWRKPEPAPPPIHPPQLSAMPNPTGLPTRLLLPAIDLDADVVELGWHPARSDAGQIFSEWDVAAYAAGWHINSAVPGEGGNVVLSAHNNILGAIFRELDQLKKGDAVSLWAGGRRYDYRIDKVMIVPETNATPERRLDNARWIGPYDDDRLTLVSCWPRDDNTHRIIVVAYPAEPAALGRQ